MDLTRILIFIIIGSIIALLIVIGSYVLGIKRGDGEKDSVYECGFSPLEDTRQPFEVRFFLVGILFIIFDLEVSILFPYSVVYSTVGMSGYIGLMIFLVVLTVGLIYE
jgi:NADH:ubiquinone oxidoreductase subunit 3 (subunit A)